MLDPRKQAKGGFGAHVERQRERERDAVADDEAANAAGGKPAQPEQAPPPAEDASAPASTGATRQPKRWH